MNFNFDTGTIDTIQTIDCSQLPPLGGTAGVLTLNGTGALLMIQGSTAQRPTGVGGMFRWNATSTFLEYFDGTTWLPLSVQPNTVSSVNISTTSTGVTVGGGPITQTGTLTVDISAGLQNLASLGSGAGTGIVVQTGVNTFVDRTINGTAGNIVVTNGNGVSGNPTIDLATVGTPVLTSFVKITTDAQGRVTSTTPVVNTDITSALGYTPVNKAGDTNVGPLSFSSGSSITFNGGTVTGLPTPVNPSDAANKLYVDSTAAGITVKQAVRAATLTNLPVVPAGTQVTHTLTAAINGALVLDGVTLNTNDRVLVKNQTTTKDNGVYVVTQTGNVSTPYVLTRAADFNGDFSNEVAAGDMVFVQDGTAQSDTGWVVYVPGNTPIVVDTDPIVWTQFTGTGSVSLSFAGDSGSPVTLVSGNTLMLDGTVNQISTFANGSNTVTFSLPQNIHTGATPTFNSVILSSLAADGVVTTNGSSQLTSTQLANGQLLIGAGAGNPAIAATLTAGTAIGITNGAGSITINNTGVTSLIPGTNMQVSAATGNVTISTVASPTFTTVTATDVNTTNLSATNGSITNLTIPGLTANSFIYSGAGGAITTTAAPTDGQILIGDTGGVPVKATLTAGTGISIVNGAGSITVNNTGVTSVALSEGSTVPVYSVTGSPVTTTGTLTFTLNNQTANRVFAGPSTGVAAQPTFRTLTYADLPLKLYVENPSSPVAPVATGTNSVAIGSGAVATAAGSYANGDGSNATVWGGDVFANGKFTSAGDAQGGMYVLRNITTDATPLQLFLDGVGGSQLLSFPSNSVVTFDILIAGRRTDSTGGGAGYRFVGVIKKDGTVGSNSFIGQSSKTVIGETNIPWNANIAADTTTGDLKITVTGEAAKTIRWVATVRTTEVVN